MSLAVYAPLAVLVAAATYSLHYTPGPPTPPIIGNLHLLPKEKPHLQFQTWAKECGPVYSLILGTKAMIVLSPNQAIKDLLDKRSGNCSSRPDLHLGQIASGASEVSGGLRMLFRPYGDTWRMIRNIVHNNLNIKAARTYAPYQELENKPMLVGFLDLVRAQDGEKFSDALAGYVSG
ncbi:hypothetical protein G6011_04307 [Alternaria panax]|uniref:Cytochrome P450 n=1 Tax=Alternaria panax TaxID=48097 RepID=A0AAD4NTS6_9PLEO|nr:hypothetical protein G6011_04307 [Alternaria panax]